MLTGLALLYTPLSNSARWRHIRYQGARCSVSGSASASCAIPGLPDVRAIGVIMTDVAGGVVVPNGTLETTPVLLVSKPGCANIRVASSTSPIGNSRRSTNIRATSRCDGPGISDGLGISKSLVHRAWTIRHPSLNTWMKLPSYGTGQVTTFLCSSILTASECPGMLGMIAIRRALAGRRGDGFT